MVPAKGKPSELSAREKFAIKQSANAISKIAGDAITARGVYTLANPQSMVTTTITGKWIPASTMTANQRFLSESSAAADVRSAKANRHVELKVKGKPGTGKRYQSTTQFVRADRTARGKVRITPKGRDYLHSIESYEQRRLRIAKARRNSRLLIIGGRFLRYGVPVLMIGWTAHDIVKGDYATDYSDDIHDAFGPLGLPITIGIETVKAGLQVAAIAKNPAPVILEVFS